MNKLSLLLSDKIEGIYCTKIDCVKLCINSSFKIISLKINEKEVEYKEEFINEKYKIIYFHKNRNEYLELKYEGNLDGTTGMYPYVRESTNNRFYILRRETNYYPSMYIPKSKEALNSYINPSEKDQWEIDIKIKGERTFATNLKEKNKVYVGVNPTIVVGDYKKFECFYGTIFCENFSYEKIREINSIIFKTNECLMKWKKEKIQNYKIIIIPNGYGSFVLPNTLILTEDSCIDYDKLVHELIHIHWNPQCDINIQKARFFDEAFTQFLTYRVCDEIGIKTKKVIEQEYINLYRQCILEWNMQPNAILNFSSYGLGDLSYSFGALSLIEIEKCIGTESMDELIKNILNNYRIKPINFELFFSLIPEKAMHIVEEYFYTSKASDRYL